jgi:quercetin dioxygenase-like cupin family protein
MPKITQIKPFFIDNRGEMLHLINNNVTINSAILITCKKGSIRANHYHKKDNHYSYLIKGKMEYFCKTHKERKIRKYIVNEGDIIFTPANEIHAMKFLEESIFIALATENRERKKYENDTVRIKLI